MSGELCCCTAVQTGEVAVIENCGKFSHIESAGCVCLIPCVQQIIGRQSLRQQELKCELETKTKDNVFVNVKISVQFIPIKQKLYEAFYTLADHHGQMQVYVFDTIRAALSELNLDQVFESKDSISLSLKTHLAETFDDYGFEVLNALIVDMTPDQRVRDAMNEINAAARQKESALQRAEGEKVLKVKRAEAEMESMYLSGLGVARQRSAIMDGLRNSITDFSSEVSGSSSKDVMDLLILTQYFDTLQELGTKLNTKVVFTVGDSNGFQQGMMQSFAGSN